MKKAIFISIVLMVMTAMILTACTESKNAIADASQIEEESTAPIESEIEETVDTEQPYTDALLKYFSRDKSYLKKYDDEVAANYGGDLVLSDGIVNSRFMLMTHDAYVLDGNDRYSELDNDTRVSLLKGYALFLKIYRIESSRSVLDPNNPYTTEEMRNVFQKSYDREIERFDALSERIDNLPDAENFEEEFMNIESELFDIEDLFYDSLIKAEEDLNNR